MTYQEKLSAVENFAKSLGCEVLRGEPLAPHTSVRTGGPADLLIFGGVRTADVEKMCKDTGLYSYILGNGSNVLFSDDGFRGAVLINQVGSESVICDGTLITAPSGVQLSAVCKAALQNGLTGLEFAYGIPGTVGGAVYMNAGAYGGEISQVVEKVEAVDGAGKAASFTLDELSLGYRTSRFAQTGEVITSVSFRLSECDPNEIKAKMEELIGRRRSRQPLEYPSFGSAFKRPEGTYAGLVIEQSGLKGFKIGGAQISPKHANFIINLGNATSADIIALIRHTQKTVREKTGYDLEPEVRIIPPEADK